MIASNFQDQLKEIFSKKNERWSETNPLMGYPRASVEAARKMSPLPRESAVMMPLFKRNLVWHTVFMLRPDGNGVHSNQLSFPGGKLEGNETHLQAALRETFEEVGILHHDITVCGELTELFIPPSQFVVKPYVGILPDNPNFVHDIGEVVRLIEVPVEYFFQEPLISESEIFIPTYNKIMNVKSFQLDDLILWGATAMMVQEFRSLFGFEK
jgi:8-oxo-dGTP pyrophosphatase MutT (NUDIX family)